VASGDIMEIRNLMDSHPHNIIIEGSRINALAKTLLDQIYVVSVSFNDSKDSVTVQVSKPEDFFNDLPTLIDKAQCSVNKMYSLDDNLEAVFRYLVGR
jgi:ABC-2 type transport system ATP-binding protein